MTGQKWCFCVYTSFAVGFILIKIQFFILVDYNMTVTELINLFIHSAWTGGTGGMGGTGGTGNIMLQVLTTCNIRCRSGCNSRSRSGCWSYTFTLLTSAGEKSNACDLNSTIVK